MLALVVVFPATAFAQGGFTIEGSVFWEDGNGDPHPLYWARVEVYQIFSDGTPSNFLEYTFSREDGGYHVTTPEIVWSAGEAQVRVVVRSENAWVECIGPEGGSYPFLGDPQTIYQAGANQVDLTVPGSGNGRALSVFQAATWAAHVLDEVRGSDPPQLRVAWPDTANYFRPSAGGAIGVRDSEAFGWDLIQHLYGHYAMHVLGMHSMPHDGGHHPGLCHGEAMGKMDGTQYAWREGLCMFYACFAQAEAGLDLMAIPGVGDALYSDTSNEDIQVDLDAQDADGQGEDNDLAVARLLWDLYDADATPEGRDDDAVSTSTLWNAMISAEARTLQTAWGAWMSSVSPRGRRFIGDVGADHGIGPQLAGPADGSSFASLPLLSWTRAVGCTPALAGDDFEVNFYDPNSSGQVLSVAVGTLTEWQMTDAVVQLLREEVDQEVLWGVSARNGESPATGPYRGETFLLSINRPPDAVIQGTTSGTCNGTGGTPLHVSGSSSTDPDGDALTYLWAAPGATLSSNEGPGITVTVPAGETWLYLTVSDGVASDTDSTLITILDDEAPVIVCPEPLVVDCEHACSTDFLVAEFLVDAAATDNCDPDPVITHDAPSCFPVGTTPVTFTATDASGNFASCTVNVTAVDDVPPTITASPSRDLLWPPNNKMSPIQIDIAVGDNCDPSPEFVLSEIQVFENEVRIPDNQARKDYDGAGFGSDDQVVDLRAKRSGGTERKYALIYEVRDASGNTARDTACVFVPESQAGAAMAASGFTENGTGFTEARFFSVLLPSSESLNALTILEGEVRVGNHLAEVAAVGTRSVLRGDSGPDLVATFSTAAVQRLISISGPSVAVSLHFNTADGGDYLVPDILKLGAPVEVENEPTPERHPREELPDGDDRMRALESGPAAVPEGPAGLYAARIERSGMVRVEVFTVTGRLVRTVLRHDMPMGTYEIPWDERDDSGRAVPSGIYFYRVLQPGGQVVKKIAVLR